MLGPLLFILYTSDLGRIDDEHGVGSHFYVDDTQLYVSATPQMISGFETRPVACMDALGSWMASNCLKINPAKTDIMRCATHQRQHQRCSDTVTFSGETIQPAPTIRDLGVILDTELSFSPHINLLVSRCFYQLRRIKSCVRSLPADAAKSVVNSFVISRIGYCNCLLAGCHKYQLDRLQTVMNTAARIILGLRKYDSIQGALRDRLH